MTDELKESIERICDILEHPGYPQMTGALVKYDDDDNIIAKCALGEISCSVGLYLRKGEEEPNYVDIMEKAGVPKWLRIGSNLPIMEKAGREVELFDIDSYQGHNIETYIYQLNDANFTYPQISEFLRCTFL